MTTARLLDLFSEIGNTFVTDDVRVSTVYFNGVYETMVLGGQQDGQTVRYPNRDAAVDGHAVMVQKVRG